jgi:hypothetical protein
MPGDLFGTYTNRAEYDAALAEWQRKKAAGDPFPGPMPRLDAAGAVEDKIKQSNFPTQIRNADFYQGLARAGAAAPDRQNPYSNVVADQSRPAQLALMAQMRQQMAGPSIAGMQGQRAMGAAGQQALMQGGRAGMLGAQNASAGLAGDVGQARLAEIMRAQAGLGGAAGNLRGADLRSAGAQMQSGLDQRRQDDLLRQFYASQGTALSDATGRLGLEGEKLRQRVGLAQKETDMRGLDTGLGAVAGIFGGFLK